MWSDADTSPSPAARTSSPTRQADAAVSQKRALVRPASFAADAARAAAGEYVLGGALAPRCAIGVHRRERAVQVVDHRSRGARAGQVAQARARRRENGARDGRAAQRNARANLRFAAREALAALARRLSLLDRTFFGFVES